MKKSSTKTTKSNKITMNDLMIHCSGDFLTDNFPTHFSTMSRGEVDLFIEEHLWEPLEHKDKDEIFDMISSSAESLATFLESKNIKISLQ